MGRQNEQRSIDRDQATETGLYNLTQEEAPMLIHFGAERSETFLLVRLEYAEEEK